MTIKWYVKDGNGASPHSSPTPCCNRQSHGTLGDFVTRFGEKSRLVFHHRATRAKGTIDAVLVIYSSARAFEYVRCTRVMTVRSSGGFIR
jgi:hypothetical protein